MWTSVVIYSILVFILSSIHGKELNTGPPGFDKFLHLIEYLILSSLLYNALKASFLYLDLKLLLWFAFFLATLYAISDEIHQIFVPMRQFDVMDIAFDGIGAFLGSYWFYRKGIRVG